MLFSNKKQFLKTYISSSLGIIVALTTLFLYGCTQDSDAKQTLPPRNWELVWSDEFEGVAGTLPDATKWAYDLGSGGWGNQELQYYTNRPENVYLDGAGHLVITAKKEAYSGASYTSARIKTQNIFSRTYGRFEARLKTPYGPGIWPAFWMLGDNIKTLSWPNCGEIDIMELRGQTPNIIGGTLHGPGYSGGAAKAKAYGLREGRFDVDYHLFAVEWFEDRIDFFMDEYLYYRVSTSDVPQWVFNTPFFLILNIAVGGNYVGFPTSETSFPQIMTIDYVRVYKKVD